MECLLSIKQYTDKSELAGQHYPTTNTWSQLQ